MNLGVVYLARDERLQRDVVLKVFPADLCRDQAAGPTLLGAARSAATLDHPNIIAVYDIGEAHGQTYIAMELVDGGTLTDLLTSGSLPQHQVLHFGLQLSDALAHAHQRGFLHGNLTSANVLVTSSGSLKIHEFGSATRSVAQDAEHMPAGHPADMAPEQLLCHPADERSDIWAVGVLLHQMATGVHPFRGITVEEVGSAILYEPPAPAPVELSPPLRAVILRCLEKERERRYQSAAELHMALESLAG